MLEILIPWSKIHYSNLPWRKKRTLYTTLVSEIMLQQTTVATVIPKFNEFIKKYPNLKKLSLSTEEEILIAWKGLGYYRRARNLRNAAIEIQQKLNGKIPTKKHELIKIKGIGEYTASAICSIGNEQEGLAIDANLERVISRLFNIDVLKGPKLHEEIQRRFDDNKIFLKENIVSYRDLNESLMDLGRVYCKLRNPSCSTCPVNKKCKALKQNIVEQRPYVVTQKKHKHELELLKLLVIKNGKVLSIKRAKGQWLEGQWDLPTFILKSTDKSLRQYPPIAWKGAIDFEIKSTITKYKIKNLIINANETLAEELIDQSLYKWVSIKSQSFTSTTDKILSKFYTGL